MTTHDIPASDVSRAARIGIVGIDRMIARACTLAENARHARINVRTGPNSVIRGVVVNAVPARILLDRGGRSVHVSWRTTVAWKGSTGIVQTKCVLLKKLPHGPGVVCESDAGEWRDTTGEWWPALDTLA